MNGRLTTVHGLGRTTLRSALCVALMCFVPPAADAQVEPGFTQNALAGSQVFGSKGCVKCHAVNGLGGTTGPDLGHIARRRSFYELAATMWNHVPRMGDEMREHGIERPQMSEQEAGDLIAFLFTLDYFDPPGDVEEGKRLFTEKKCVVCHQVGVYGGVVGPSLDHLGQYGSPILVAASMWNHGPAMAEFMEEQGVPRPTFTGSELTDLISYLESATPASLAGPLYVLPGNAEEGRVLFTEKGCNACHSVQGVGGHLASDLAERGQHWGLTEFAAALWNKGPTMTKMAKTRDLEIPQLGAGEMADLVAYLYSVQYFAEPGDAENGRQLLGSKGCLACHSLEGQGGTSAADLNQRIGMGSPSEVVSSLWNHSALMEAADTVSVKWPQFSPAEMADIAAFMQSTANQR
jgi:cytochrome c551/c552